MTELHELGITVWPLRRLVESARAGQEIPSHVTAVTFDDGYESVYSNAWPVLKSLGIPATVFLATAYVGQSGPFPFERWSKECWNVAPPDSWRPLNWWQCRRLHASGLIEIGSHSHTHVNFRDQPDAFQTDFEMSLDLLRREMGIREPPFSFPYGSRELGNVQDAFVRVVEESAAVCGLTTEIELIDPISSPYQWGCLEVTQSDTGRSIKAKLDGWYNWVAGARRIYRRLAPPAYEALGMHQPCRGESERERDWSTESPG